MAIFLINWQTQLIALLNYPALALRDPRVTETLANLIESKIEPLIDTIAELKSENERKAATILKLTTRVEELETYTRRDNR